MLGVGPWRRPQMVQRSMPGFSVARSLRLLPVRRVSSSRDSGRVLESMTKQPLSDPFGTPFGVRSRALLPLRVVENRHVKRALPLLGNAAYLALASGFVMTDILALRALLVGGYAALTCFHLLHPKPLRIPLRWSALFVVVNAAMATRIALERYPSNLSDADEVVRAAFFERLTPAQFVSLLELGERRRVPKGTALTLQREPCDHLYFVVRGVANLYVHDEWVAQLGRGGFLNDVAFHQGGGAGAYGTIVAHEEMEVIAWNQVRDARTLAHTRARSRTIAIAHDRARSRTLMLAHALPHRYRARAPLPRSRTACLAHECVTHARASLVPVRSPSRTRPRALALATLALATLALARSPPRRRRSFARHSLQTPRSRARWRTS